MSSNAQISKSQGHGATFTECPVCFHPLHNTKILECGHTLCEPCVTKLFASGRGIQCPTCQQLTKKSPSELPRNYTLEDIQQREEANGKKFPCIRCKRTTNNDDFITCKKCNIDLCHKCIILSHQGHQIAEIDDFLKKNEVEFERMRKSVADVYERVVHQSQSVELNNAKIISCMDAIKDIVEEKNELFADTLHRLNQRLSNANVSQFINEQQHGEVTSLKRWHDEISVFEEKQKQLKDVSLTFLTGIEKFQERMRKLTTTGASQRVEPLLLPDFSDIEISLSDAPSPYPMPPYPMPSSRSSKK